MRILIIALAIIIFFTAVIRGVKKAKLPAVPCEKYKFIIEPWLYVTLAVWIIILNTVFIIWAFNVSPREGLVKALENIWYNTIDANNYVEIAEHWYFPVDGSDLQYKIAFFPLYPIIMRIVKSVTGNYPVAGMIVSSLCAFIGGLLLYKLVCKELGFRAGRRAIKYLFIFPSAFFFVVPMTEGLFLLLTVAFFYALIGKRYALAGIAGFFAALTRSQGILLAAPLALEVLLDAIYYYNINSIKNRIYYILGNGIFAVLPVLGTGVYLLINLQVYGTPFQFMVYQNLHWNNSLSWFWKTPVYLTEYLVSYFKNGDMWLVRGLSIPNLIAFWLGLGLTALGARRLRPSLTLYSLLYFAMSFGVTWLLSGPRYLACMFPLALTAADIENKSKTVGVILMFIYALMFVTYMYFFINRWYVY